MAPRGHTLPQATTESAREARKSFFCELCQKGYARMNEFEAHEGSYDHQHRKRLKEMRHLTRDPAAIAKARAADQSSTDMKSLSNPLSSTSSAAPGKKKPVFKSTLQPENADILGPPPDDEGVEMDETTRALISDPTGAIRNGYKYYDPLIVTGCEDPRCRHCQEGELDLCKAFGISREDFETKHHEIDLEELLREET